MKVNKTKEPSRYFICGGVCREENYICNVIHSMQKPLNGLGYGLLEYNILWVRNSFIQDNPAAKIWYVSDTCRKISTSLSENNTISEADELFLLNLMNASNNFAATMYDETGNLIAEAFNSKHFNDSLAAYVTQIYTP